MCVLSIKVSIRKKSGNLSYAPRIYLYLINVKLCLLSFMEFIMMMVVLQKRFHGVYHDDGCSAKKVSWSLSWWWLFCKNSFMEFIMMMVVLQKKFHGVYHDDGCSAKKVSWSLSWWWLFCKKSFMEFIMMMVVLQKKFHGVYHDDGCSAKNSMY